MAYVKVAGTEICRQSYSSAAMPIVRALKTGNHDTDSWGKSVTKKKN